MLRSVFVGLVVALSSLARADFILIRDLEQQGLATVTASAWDIGHKDALFDRDWDNIYRSASINPAIITVEFVNAPTVGAMRGLVAASPTEITLEAANTLADLNNQTGSFIRIINAQRFEDSIVGWAEWNDTPVTRKFWRFRCKRLERDDYVHIRELELQTPEPVQQVLINGQLVRINVIEVTPEFAEIPVGQTQQFTGEASLSYGPTRYNVTSIATWTTDAPGVATINANGLATGAGVGQTLVNADIGVVHAESLLGVRAVRPIDLNVGFIHRSPEYERFHIDFSGDQRIAAGYENQKKWPDPGELVTYTAHVFNKGDLPAANVPYEWRFDGVVVDAGVIPLMNPGQRVQLTYQRPWPADVVQTVDINPGAEIYQPAKYRRAVGNHTIQCTLDPGDVIAESSEMNNSIKDYINAIQFHFYMEQHTYDEFGRKTNFIETYSPEDWAQLQMQALQRKLWVSGGRQRFRLSNLQVVPDGTLDPGGTHEPIGNVTWTTDGVWGFDWPSDYLEIHRKRVDQALVHELGHQIGLIDIYNYDVATSNMLIRYNGSLVAGTARMPLVSPWNVMYGNERYWYDNGVARIDWSGRGAMANTGARFFSKGAVAGMNRNLGLRRGFYGDYLGAIPQDEIKIRLVNHPDTPVPGAQIRIFQRERNGTVPNNPKFSGVTDANGLWTFPSTTLPAWYGGIAVNNPWSSVYNGWTFNAPEPVGNNAPLVVEAVWNPGTGTIAEYHFIECDELNVAFSGGSTEDYTYTIVTHASRAGNHLPVMTFTTGEYVWIDEGSTFTMRVLVSDADGDPVTLSATPMPNSDFNPATGRFTYTPDSLDVTDAGGAFEAGQVLFVADDGKFRAVKALTIHVRDVDGFAMLRPVVPDEPVGCPADFNGDALVNFFDVQAFLNAFSAHDDSADLNADGVWNFFDVQMFLNVFSAGCG